MGGGSAEVQKKLRKQMYLDYRCIPNSYPHRHVFSEKNTSDTLTLLASLRIVISGVTPSEAVLCTSEFLLGECVRLWYQFPLALQVVPGKAENTLCNTLK